MRPFAPLRVRGSGADRLRRALRRQRRAAAAGLALAGAALATTGLGAEGEAGPSGVPSGAGRSADRLVSAPVRIADPETVRLLRPGDRVDVIAVGDAGGDARVVAQGVRVAEVPHTAVGPGGAGTEAPGSGAKGTAPAAGAEGAGVSAGTLVVLSVERPTATELLGASASGQLAVAVSDAN
ncbi:MULTISPECIES: RcpC/CpaB family pilus assembly protein [unclassified Streptomyces]|uniref:RcpC/CpaB family pilus assembly protein n=1 Tax=unclassified Streptomyces TaxID=2593676 RepID=UPI0033232020